jgi:hypothetical protein
MINVQKSKEEVESIKAELKVLLLKFSNLIGKIR